MFKSYFAIPMQQYPRARCLVRIFVPGWSMTFHITLTPEEGWVVAECPALPGCVSQGRDEEEAIRNIREAITAWMWAEDQKAIKGLPASQTPVLVAV
jgi:predicted RNase H-like HicB family nuclease